MAFHDHLIQAFRAFDPRTARAESRGTPASARPAMVPRRGWSPPLALDSFSQLTP
jgi:hypothetical protein